MLLIMDPSANVKHVFMEETKESARNVEVFLIVFIIGTDTPVLTVMAEVIQCASLQYCM